MVNQIFLSIKKLCKFLIATRSAKIFSELYFGVNLFDMIVSQLKATVIICLMTLHQFGSLYENLL